MTSNNNNAKDFENAIRAHGWDPGSIYTDGKFHRFDTDKRGDKCGWYLAFADGDFHSGCYGSWKEGSKYNFCSKNGTRTDADQEIYKRRMAEAKQVRIDEGEKAKRQATWIWKNATEPAEDHPYLLNKGIKAHGAKQYKDALVVPVMKDGEITSMQFISGDASKRFLGGGTVAGGRFEIPGDGDQILCEGFATGASIHEATGQPVVVAFNASNLFKLAEPGWTIAGDNDAFTQTKEGSPWNPGQEKALAAAWEHNCKVVIPTFPRDTGKGFTDFNDLATLKNMATVAGQIGGAVYAHEYLLEELKTDVGAAFRKEHMQGLKTLKERDKPAYMTLRAKLKKLKIGITELENDFSQIRGDGGGAVNHLTLAREVVAGYGDGNLIHTIAFTWRWSSTGVWVVMDDREIKQAIHVKAEKALDGPTKSIIDSVLDLTKTEIFIPSHKWDVDKTTVNCLNGELAWSKGEWAFQEHSREHYRTTQIPVTYDVNATAPRFEQFLLEVFNDDQDSNEKRLLICEAMGYTLLSSTKYEKFFLLIGPGANGKSVLMDAVAELVGLPNVVAVQPSQFENRFQRAHLHNKLMNCVTELAQGAEIHDAQLKAIVSGEITTAEHKHKPPFDFQPFATCWFGSNHMPHTRDFSDALFRRAVILPFNRIFSESEQDKDLKYKLKSELPGILNLALDGISGVLERGYFTKTKSSEDAKRDWRLNSDQAAEFATDKCKFEPYLSIESQHLYQAYESWSEDAGIRRTLNRKNFTLRIERLGAKLTRGTGGVRTLAGIDLVNPGI